MKILLSAFACDPTQGSELGNGWNWASGLAAKGFEVHCITRGVSKANIESVSIPENLHFHYLNLPIGLDRLYSLAQVTMYIHYIIWQWLALKRGIALHKKIIFDVAHHVTWGSVQLGSFLYKLKIPFIFGPAGGGQKSPDEFKEYFESSWAVERKREKVSNLLISYNPACKNMVKRASAIWVSNPDTLEMVKRIGCDNVQYTLDAALADTFFPKLFSPKVKQKERLDLLWVGRLMPRKGALLLLEVMQQLKNFPGITLTIVGDGEQREALLASIREKELGNTVFWKGKVPFSEVKEFYASKDAFFFTSLRDSCPAQLIEAMAYGMPVITLNLHGQAIIVNDDTGFRAACNNPQEAIESLRDSILTLYYSDSLLTAMSACAHDFALKQTWEYKISTIVTKCYPSID